MDGASALRTFQALSIWALLPLENSSVIVFCTHPIFQNIFVIDDNDVLGFGIYRRIYTAPKPRTSSSSSPP
jgi:hypothetical protein